jgi:ATPase subunit of ABC transporter with duplicated ATPase domains
MVIVSHDREFLDQLCTKIVEVERGVVRGAFRSSLLLPCVL